jgi:hypothetical protein
MLRFLARHGLVRVVGGRAVPVLLAWDLIVLADRMRRIPVVDRGLRRGAGAAGRWVVAGARSERQRLRSVGRTRWARRRGDRAG